MYIYVCTFIIFLLKLKGGSENHSNKSNAWISFLYTPGPEYVIVKSSMNTPVPQIL